MCIFLHPFFLELSQKEPSAEEEEEEEETCGVLEAQVLSLSQVVRDNSAEIIRHVHGSHVVRTLLHVLAGCLGPPRTESRPGTHMYADLSVSSFCLHCTQGCTENYYWITLIWTKT